MMTGEQAKQALQRSTPYVTIGNLVAMCALVVMLFQAGMLRVPGTGVGGAQPTPAEVRALARQVARQSDTLASLQSKDRRQDQALENTERWIGQRMQRVENKVDRIYELLIRRGDTHSGPGGPS